METPLDKLVRSALELDELVSVSGLEPAHAVLLEELDRVKGEVDLDALLPDCGGALGMAANQRDPISFERLFLAHIRKQLCSKNGEFHKLVLRGLDTSVSATLTAMVMQLSLPVAALPLLIPISVMICQSGLRAFCQLE